MKILLVKPIIARQYSLYNVLLQWLHVCETSLIGLVLPVISLLPKFPNYALGTTHTLGSTMNASSKAMLCQPSLLKVKH